MASKNNNPKGIFLILMAMMVFSIQDSIMKYIFNFASLYEVYIVRTLVSFALILLFLKLTKKPVVFKSKYPLLTFIRVILFFFGFSFFYVSLTVLPLATATALFFVTPFLITIFASMFLKEKVGIRRWTAVIIGFIGVIFVIYPQNIDFNFLFIFPIIAAIFLTIRDITTKGIATKSNSFEIIFITSVLMTLFSGIGSLFFDFTFKIEYLSNLFISSLFLTIAYVFSVLTIFYAPLSLTASSRYSVIVFGMLFGYLVLNEIPSINMIIGAVIISLSGLFVINREKKLGKIK